jgi:hypothetical protein
VILETVKAGLRADAETGPQNVASLAACDVLNTAHQESDQGNLASRGPSPEAMEACDEFLLDELASAFDLIESYAISGKEAARRRDRDEVRLRLRMQLRDCFRHAVQVHDLLSPGPLPGGGS